MTDEEFEVRPFVDPVEVRSEVEDGKRILKLSGTAIRYGARSRDLGGFRERIMAGAAREVLRKGEVFAYEEHRNDRYLGRTGNATLRLIDTKESLRYEVLLPDTAVGREVAHLAERGDYRGSSFGFRPLAEAWGKDEDGLPLRTVTTFRTLRDVGPTVSPAYEDTTAEMALRSLAENRGIEFRSVLAAAKAGTLAELIEGAPVLGEAGDAGEAAGTEAAEVETTPPVIHRRPTHWFV